jgi:MerR family transcriptional regulator, light-induced transcriptional regulator
MTWMTPLSTTMSTEVTLALSTLTPLVGNFETYSAECESRSPADAALHRYLKNVAGNARAMLEEALLRVVEAEGISLPAL